MKKIILILIAAFCIIHVYINLQNYLHLAGVDFEDVARKEIALVSDSLNNIMSEVSILTQDINRHIQNSSKELDKEAVLQLINKYDRLFFFDRLYYITKRGREYIINEITLVQDSVYMIKPILEKVDEKWLERSFLSSGYNWIGPVFDSIHDKRAICKPLNVTVPNISDTIYIIAVYNVSQIYQYMQNSGLNKFGVAYIVDTTSHFIAHPLDETRSLIDLGHDYNNKVLTGLGRDIVDRSFTNKDYIHTNTVTGLKCNEMIYPLPEMNAYLGVSVYDGESLESRYYQTEIRRVIIRLSIYSLLFIIALSLVLSLYSKKSKHTRLQISSSLAFLILTICIIFTYNRYPQNDNSISTLAADRENIEAWKWDSLRTIDKETVNKLIENYRKESLVLYNGQPKVIPTGAYIYDIQFTNSHEVKISGVVWQKYLKYGECYPDDMLTRYQTDTYKNKGVLFPGARISDLNLKDTLEVILDNHPVMLYRWDFDIDIGQKMSYSLYPFGKNEIIVPFWSMDLDDNTLLIPDFDSYKQIYPTNLPGLNSHFSIKGWNLLSSYFSYSYDSYLCSFGNMDMYGINQFPELTFNVSISRKFLDILISKIVPLFVILTLLYTLIFIRKKEDGFNNVIGCSGLFFVLVLDHINLRETVLSEGIMYIEFCYFISYIILLLVTVTSFEVDKKQSLYAKTLDFVLRNYFWSIILGAMIIVSILYFY